MDAKVKELTTKYEETVQQMEVSKSFVFVFMNTCACMYIEH